MVPASHMSRLVSIVRCIRPLNMRARAWSIQYRNFADPATLLGQFSIGACLQKMSKHCEDYKINVQNGRKIEVVDGNVKQSINMVKNVLKQMTTVDWMTNFFSKASDKDQQRIIQEFQSWGDVLELLLENHENPRLHRLLQPMMEVYDRFESLKNDVLENPNATKEQIEDSLRNISSELSRTERQAQLILALDTNNRVECIQNKNQKVEDLEVENEELKVKLNEVTEHRDTLLKRLENGPDWSVLKNDETRQKCQRAFEDGDRGLKLSFEALTDDEIGEIAKALVHNKTLEVLELVECSITDVGAAHLAQALKNNATLAILFINRNPITNEGLRHLTQVLRNNTTLKYIALSMHDSSAPQLVHPDDLVEDLKHNKTLNYVIFDETTNPIFFKFDKL